AGGTSEAPSPTSTGAAIVPSTVQATDGSDRSTMKTGSTSTTDNNGQPTVIPAPFYVCSNPLCIHTGCILAILCSAHGGAAGFGGFPPPNPPPDPPADTGDDSPTGTESQSSPSATSPTSLSSVSTTASASSSSSSSGTCAPITTVADPGPTSAGDPDDGSSRRIRRTLGSRILDKREAPVISTIGTCKLTNPVKIPLYSSFGSAMKLGEQRNGNRGANGRIYDVIEKWYAENLAVDGTPFLGAKLDNTFNSTGPGSIDHVWEKSNVGDFLGSSLGSDFDCDDMNSLFFSCGNKLQKIFDQLPSMDPNNVQTGFAAMNRNLNGMKGWMFSQGFSVARFSQIYSSDNKVMQGLERQAIIFNWFNSDTGIQSLHDATNNRIYGAFLALDDYISKNKIQRANGRGDLTQRFGPAFRTWYGQLLTSTGSATYKWASDQVTRLDADTSLPDCLRRAINAFQFSPLYSQDRFRIDQSHLSWTGTPISLKRSLVFERDDTVFTFNAIRLDQVHSRVSYFAIDPHVSDWHYSSPNRSLVVDDSAYNNDGTFDINNPSVKVIAHGNLRMLYYERFTLLALFRFSFCVFTQPSATMRVPNSSLNNEPSSEQQCNGSATALTDQNKSPLIEYGPSDALDGDIWLYWFFARSVARTWPV
ncbi:MAG: hypothetical protein LQ338_006748, partial [Usnochroma carphineum]